MGLFIFIHEWGCDIKKKQFFLGVLANFTGFLKIKWLGVVYDYVITWMKVLSHGTEDNMYNVYSCGIIGVIVHSHVINI